MQFTILHRTTYRYPTPIHESYSLCHLQPLSDTGQYCTRFELNVVPRARIFSYDDRFGNNVHHFSLVPEHEVLSIVASSTVTTARERDPKVPDAVTPEQLRADPEYPRLYDYLHPSPLVEFGNNLHALSRELGPADGDLVTWFINAGRYLRDAFTYDKRATSVHTSVSESIRLRAGVCQDYAHVFIALCRVNGIPARYASGYVFSGQGESLLGAEASHAWCEAYLPPHGWVGYDPTNARLVNEYFVKLAVGRDYRDVSPVRGLYKGLAESTMQVNVAMDELYSAARERQYELEAQQQQQQ